MPTTSKPKAKQSVIMKGLPWIAVVAVVAAISLFVHTTLFYMNAKEATCSVLAVDVLRSAGSTTTYRPTIKYTDDQGQSHTVEFTVASSHYNFSVGQKVAILYDPQSPQSVGFNTFMGVWGLTGGVAFAALVIVILTWLSMAAQRHKRREKAIQAGKVLSDNSGNIDLPSR